MKSETWMFLACTVFMVLVTPAYWFVTSASKEGGDWTGSAALVMCTFLMAMITAYLGVHARKMDERPEDRNDAEISEGAGEYGFFPPFSWWPLWVALAFAMVVLSVAMAAWWLLIIAALLAFIATAGWNFEYYRGEFKH